MLKETYTRLRYFILVTCHAPHVLILLLRNSANVGNIYNLSQVELIFLKISLITGIALLIKLTMTTFIFFFSCQRSVCALKFFIILYMLDLLSGITICFDSFIRRELWKPHLTEDIHNVSIVEIAYVSLVGIMVLVDGFNIYITWQALHRGIFRRRSIISKEMRAHLKSAPLRVNRSSGKAKKHNKKRDKQKLVV
jgi:hypothetical protein